MIEVGLNSSPLEFVDGFVWRLDRVYLSSEMRLEGTTESNPCLVEVLRRF